METKVALTAEQLRMAQEKIKESRAIFNDSLEGMLETYLKKAEIEKAKKMFVCRHAEAMKAYAESKWDLHKINDRADKPRADKDDWITNKLPRNIQQNTNIVGSFFMFGNSLKFYMKNCPEEAKELQPAFNALIEYMHDHYFDERMYSARQITGSELECAKEFVHCRTLDGKSTEVICRLRYNSKGDFLYSLFDEYDRMVAFAIGYFLRDDKLNAEEHFDVYTARKQWRFRKGNEAGSTKWSLIDEKTNPFGKIPIIYYTHEVDWNGAQENIDHLEWVNSKRADTVEYFGDPYLMVTQDVVPDVEAGEEAPLADAREVGKVITVDGPESRFEYVTPPEGSELVENEKKTTLENILQDTMTPDWSYKSIMGLGTLSGEAMRRMNLPGYTKRNNLAVRVYNELINREVNLYKTILADYVYLNQAEMRNNINRLRIGFTYTDPFQNTIDDNSTQIATLTGANGMSIYSAVEANGNVIDKEAEYERIFEEMERKAAIEAKVNTAQQSQQTKQE